MKSFFDVHRQAQARYDALMKPYILDADGRPTPIDMSTDAGWMAWSEWFDTADRKVAHDQLGIEYGQPAFEVSTVFLGLEHGQDEAGAPLLYETLVFVEDGTTRDMRRYASREAAQAGHARIVGALRDALTRAEATGEALIALMRLAASG